MTIRKKKCQNRFEGGSRSRTVQVHYQRVKKSHKILFRSSEEAFVVFFSFSFLCFVLIDDFVFVISELHGCFKVLLSRAVARKNID